MHAAYIGWPNKDQWKMLSTKSFFLWFHPVLSTHMDTRGNQVSNLRIGSQQITYKYTWIKTREGTKYNDFSTEIKKKQHRNYQMYCRYIIGDQILQDTISAHCDEILHITYSEVVRYNIFTWVYLMQYLYIGRPEVTKCYIYT